MRENMNKEMTIIDNMKKLGFSEYEAKTYLSLLEDHPVNGYTLSKNSGIPRSRIYEVLEGLKKRQIVFEKPGEKSTLYYPVSPHLLMDSLKNDYNCIISNINQHMEKIHKKNDDNRLIVISGRTDILKFMKDMINRSEKRIALSIWHDDLSELSPELDNALSRGVSLCGIYFGTNSIFSQLTPHRRIDRYMAERKERFLTATIDNCYAVSGIVSRDDQSQATCTTDRGFIEMSEDYICHDLMVNLYSEKLAENDKKNYEDFLDRIRKNYFGYSDEEFSSFDLNKP